MPLWPDNAQAVATFARLGTRWAYGPSGAPVGLRWEAIYPLLDRMGLSNEAWSDLVRDLEVMESEALAVAQENRRD